MPEKLTLGGMTWEMLEERHGIREAPRQSLVEGAQPVEPSPVLLETLRRARSARLINERARAYYLIHPVLAELAVLRAGKVFSLPEVPLQVEGAEGLCGTPDFILSGSSTHKIVPILVVVEAKREDIESGLPQCAAELYAAYLLNDSRPSELYGVVTTGMEWQFLRLEVEGSVKRIRVEKTAYMIAAELPAMLGAFCYIIDRALAALSPAEGMQ